MTRVDRLKAEIETLRAEQFAELLKWLTDKDWERWDRQIQTDYQAGRLDFLIEESREEKT